MPRRLKRPKVGNIVNSSSLCSYRLSGSAKPKLVPKASGSDMSPWKMQNNAPKISAKEVPGHLRPLMSCALWRLHESIDRNDFNQLFLLSDQEEICTTAKKLNITVRSSKELGEKIAASIEKVDLNVTGMLEEENLAKPEERAKLAIPKDSATEDLFENTIHKASAHGELLPCGDHVGQNDTADGKDDVERPKSSTSETDTNLGTSGSEKPAIAVQDKTLPSELSNSVTEVGLDPKELVKSILNPSLLQAQVQHGTEETRAEDTAKQPRYLHAAVEILQATSDQKRGQEVTQPKPSAELPNLAAKPAPFFPQESLEDSDEEVVVFVPNPKRMSAQKKANVSSSRPTTAHGQSTAPPKQDSPKNGASKVHAVSNATGHGSPNAKLVPHGHPRPLSSGSILTDPGQGSANVNVVPRAHPQPFSSGPTVIDPDTFGRGFAASTGPGTLANVGTSRRSRQHSPRTSLQGPISNPNGTSSQNSPHASPPRHRAGHSPRPSSRAVPQKIEDSSPTSIPVISHQAYTRAPLVAPNAQSMQKSRFGPIGPPSKSGNNLYPSAPAGDADFNRDLSPRQAPVQRPRSANGSGIGNAPNSTHHQLARQNLLNNSAPPAREHQTQKSSKKSLFEPELDHTEAQPNADSEPRRTNMPEVQYTLKSGTTREAARGKGKLWVG